jgi:excisionase family DNA binding protein
MATKTRQPMMPPEGATLLTLEEVAFLLKNSVTSVRRLVKAGRLKSVAVTVSGAARRVRRESLDDFIRSGEQGGSEPEPVKSTPMVPSYSMVKAGWDGKDRLAGERPKKTRPKLIS